MWFCKNRMVATNALPHFLQGPEAFPNDQVIEHIAGLARNGAAVVQFADWSDPEQRISFNPDGKRFPMYDLTRSQRPQLPVPDGRSRALLRLQALARVDGVRAQGL